MHSKITVLTLVFGCTLFIWSSVELPRTAMAGVEQKRAITSNVSGTNSAGRRAAQTTEQLGWRIGPAAWSFRKFTFFDAIDKTAVLGMHYIESFQGQKISKNIDVGMSYDLPDEVLEKIRQKLDSAGVRLTSHYIGSLPGEEARCRRIFEFGRKMGIEAFISEPDPANLDTIEKCCKEYGIALAIHNHPKGRSRYWHPREVLAVCRGRSKWFGACGDTGHWIRSGIRPVDAVRILEGRLISLHVKDLNSFGGGGHDVPWGTGTGEIEALLRESHRQGANPVLFGIEYEHNWENSMPEIARCASFFHTTVQKLSPQAPYEPTWESLKQHTTPQWYLDAKSGITEIEAVLAKAPRPPVKEKLRKLNIVLVADKKDHGPSEHDYPLWQKRWKVLLGGQQASETSETQVNLYGPSPANSGEEVLAGVPEVNVTTAQKWPSKKQFKSANLIVMFCYCSWSEQQTKDLDAYLSDGGGFVGIHSALWKRKTDNPSQEAVELTGLMAEDDYSLWRHGPMDLKITARKHPICLGLPEKIHFVDESYWSLKGDQSKVEVLATSDEEIRGGSGGTRPEPMFWVSQRGKGRVFGCILGHYNWTFDDPYFRILLLRGMAWATGESPYRFDSLVLRGVRLSGPAANALQGKRASLSERYNEGTGI